MRIQKVILAALVCVCLAACGGVNGEPLPKRDLEPGAVLPGGKTGVFEPEGGIAIRWAELDDGSYGIVGPKEQDPKGKLIIPDQIEGVPVTVIDPFDAQLAGASLPNGGAFLGKEGITGLAIGQNVVQIGFESFLGCTNLEGKLELPPKVQSIGQSAFAGTGICSVEFSQGLKSLGAGAFYDCPNLKGTVTLPAGLTSIEQIRSAESDPHLFLGSTGVTAIEVEEGSECYQSIDGVLYKKGETGLVLVECPQGKTGAFCFPQEVTVITSYAFAGCGLQGEICIPDEVTRLDREFDYGFEAVGHVFAESKNITGVTLGKGITYLPKGTFAGCTALRQVVLPKELVGMDANAFENCPGLKTIVYSGTEEQWNKVKNKEQALKNLPQATVRFESE